MIVIRDRNNLKEEIHRLRAIKDAEIASWHQAARQIDTYHSMGYLSAIDAVLYLISQWEKQDLPPTQEGPSQ